MGKYLHGDCGEYGRYHELSVLPDKIARYLFEFYSDSYASLHLPEIPEDRSQVNVHALMNPPQVLHRILFVHVLALIYIQCIWTIQWHILHIFAYFQVRAEWRALCDTLKLLQSAKHGGHLRMYSTLLIGHKNYPGEQRVCCWPFKGRQLQKSNSQDMVMVRPPGIDKGGFQLRIDNVWFCKVLFLFSTEWSSKEATLLCLCLCSWGM